jgi:DNA-directed RNA polymerase specialized sigma24 family protein
VTGGTEESVSLTEALRGGAPEAFGLLYDEYSGRLYAYGHIMVGDEAADVVRDAFIAAARHPGTAPADDAALPVWLYALARSECVRRGAFVHKPAVAPSVAPSADPLRRTLARLRPEHREVLALSATLETPEIARVIGVAADTAEMLLRVSRRRLEQAAASVLGTVRDEPMPAALGEGSLHKLLTREYAPPPRQRERVLFSCAAAGRAPDGALLFDQDGMPIPLDSLFGTAEDATHPFTAVREKPSTGPLRPVDPDPLTEGVRQVRRVRPSADHARPRPKKESFLSRRRDGFVEVAGLAACVVAATGALALWPSPHDNGGASNMDGTSLLIHRSAAASRSAEPVPSVPGTSSTPPPQAATSKPGASPSPSPSKSTAAPTPPATTAPERPAPPPADGPPDSAHPTPTPTWSSPTTTPAPTPAPTPSDSPTGTGGDGGDGGATPTPEPSGS